MSTAPRTEERRISSDNIVLSYCKENQLYLIFREAIDPDMAPVPGDFTVVDRARPVHVYDLDVLQTEDYTTLVLLLKDRIRFGNEIGIRYKPTQWFMCWQDSGDAVDPFEQSVFPEGQNATDLSKFGEPQFEEIESDDTAAETVQAASLGYVCDFRIQIKFNPGLDTSSSPIIDDFRAEMADRWLKISSIKYFHVHRGVAQDLIISLSEPMPVGSRIHIAYKSPSQRLQTISGEAVASFQLDATVEESPQSFISDYQPPHDEETDVDDEIVLENVAGVRGVSRDSLDELDAVIDGLKIRESGKILSHEEVVNLVEENFPLLDDVVETEAPTPLPRVKPTQKEINAANDEKLEHIDTVAPAVAKSEQQTKQPNDKETSEEAKPERKIVGTIEAIDYSKIKPSIPGGLAHPQIQSRKIDQSEPVSKEQSALEKLVTKWLYLLPIAFTAWLLFVVMIYVSIIFFDIELPSFSGDSPTAVVQEQQTPQKEVAAAPKREQCELTSEDGGVYKGECLNGIRDGHGVYVWPSGNRYDGKWKNGKQHGLGKLTYNNGAVYTGEFANGVEDGGGLMRWPNGSQYQGGYKKGIFHGHGEYRNIDGTRYVGVFENGIMTEDGTCFTKEGNQVKGPCSPSQGR